jgi:endonuclease/exonuclease/phosphatase (EEP) superfamily protein YafD
VCDTDSNRQNDSRLGKQSTMSRWPKTSDHAVEDDCNGKTRGTHPGLAPGFRSFTSLAATVTALVLALAAAADWFGWVGELVSAMGWRISVIGSVFATAQWLAKHRRRSIITATASFLALAPTLLLSPRAPAFAASSSGVRLRLLVANVHALNDSTDELVKMLSESDADVLILTEPPPAVMQALRPNALLARQFPFITRSKPDRGIHAWLVVASREPLTQGSGATPGVNPVVISFAQQDIAIIATHLISPRSPARYRQAREQVQYVASLAQEQVSRNVPLIVAGDLNTPPGSHLSRHLTKITGTMRAKPRQILAGSWPSQIPRWAALPIDGAAVSAGITVENWLLVDLPGSDHRGLRIDLRIAKTDSDAQSHHSGSSPPNP